MPPDSQKNPELKEVKPVILLLNNGQIQEALKKTESLLSNFPDSPLLFNLRGACFKSMNNLEKAAESFEHAINAKPDFSEALFNLGITLKELGRIDSSIESYEKAIAIKPAYPDAHNNLGNLLLANRQLDSATDHFEWAIAFKPDFEEAYNNLGIVKREQNKTEQAIENFKKAITINPEYSQAYLNLGLSFKDLGQMDNAVNCYKELISKKPSFAQGHFNLGIAYKELGLIDNAVESLEMAITINPDYALAYYNLGSLNQYIFSDLQLHKMQSLLASKQLIPNDRINLSFALAKVNEDLGDHNEFFKYLNEGNRLRRKELNYSLDKIKSNHLVIRQLFNIKPQAIDNLVSTQEKCKRPIFIVGMPRSGSTLVEQILASHRMVHGAGEFQALRKILNPIVREYLNQKSPKASALVGDQRMEISKLNKLSKEKYKLINNEYLDMVSKLNFSENIFTDKSLLNFQFIGFILTAFPNAKIIHLKRDARAICWSIYKNNLPQKGIGFGNNFNDLSEFYNLYTKLMNFWHELYPEKIYDLVYENLTKNQEKETKKLLKYCDLDWDENCLNFHNTKREVKTASVLQVRKKMYQGSSEAWKEYEAHLEPLLNGLRSF